VCEERVGRARHGTHNPSPWWEPQKNRLVLGPAWVLVNRTNPVAALEHVLDSGAASCQPNHNPQPPPLFTPTSNPPALAAAAAAAVAAARCCCRLCTRSKDRRRQGATATGTSCSACLPRASP